METSQRVLKETTNDDNRTISNAVESTRYLAQLLNNSHRMMQDFSALAETYKTSDILTGTIMKVSDYCLRFNICGQI